VKTIYPSHTRTHMRTHVSRNPEYAAPSRPPAPSSTLEGLAERLVRLSLCHRNPEQWHLEKHSLASDMRRLARELRRAAS